jgi:DNA (cytosine-5)-methyltransferase 1
VNNLVLSIFPGIDLLGRAFEEQGYCVVRGPDVLWGGDITTFHPPVGVFDGVIGGPPCQCFSRLRYINPKCGERHGNLIPEFERVVAEAQPNWFVMENVPEASEPMIKGYLVRSLVLNNRWLPDANGFGAEQTRLRRVTFGTPDGWVLPIELAALEAYAMSLAVTSGHAAVPVALERDAKGGLRRKKRISAERSIAEVCRLQGLPEDFLNESPFTNRAARKMIGNGVPLATGRAIAKAVKRAFEVLPWRI